MLIVEDSVVSRFHVAAPYQDTPHAQTKGEMASGFNRVAGMEHWRGPVLLEELPSSAEEKRTGVHPWGCAPWRAPAVEASSTRVSRREAAIEGLAGRRWRQDREWRIGSAITAGLPSAPEWRSHTLAERRPHLALVASCFAGVEHYEAEARSRFR